MMYGMFGFGWLMMLLVIGLPILLVILLLAGSAGFFKTWGQSGTSAQNQPPMYYSTANANLQTSNASRYCSHCGAGLQSDWTHCPQCGAPIQ